MERLDKSLLSQIDWGILSLYISLSIIGILSIYSVGYDGAKIHYNALKLGTEFGKQIFWLSSSMLLIVVCFFIPQKYYENYAGITYIITILALSIVFIFGKKVGGATSWFSLFGISLQPSEFAKLGTALAVSKMVSDPNKSLKNSRYLFSILLLIILPITLILLQPDPGSALIFLSFFYVLHLIGGLNFSFVLLTLAGVLFVLNLILPPYIIYIITGLCGVGYFWFSKKRKRVFSSSIQALVLSGVILAYHFSVIYTTQNLLKEHHRTRINILLGKIEDPKGVGYNTQQSIIAIGSGGVLGKGFLAGTQTKGEFVPEQSTDFIFCTIGEEFGFLGSSLVVILFSFLILRIFITAQNQRSPFTKAFGYSLGSILLLHFLINISMTIGLGPVIGIPLPFVSYGGSSMLSFSLMLGIYLSLNLRRLQVL